MTIPWNRSEFTPVKIPSVAKPSNPFASRRKFPRRIFEKMIGFLYRGNYSILKSTQLSEGGMGILADIPAPIKNGDTVVVTFQLPGQELIIARAEVRDVRPPDVTKRKRISLMFIDFGFYPRRKVREFISAKGPNEPDV